MAPHAAAAADAAASKFKQHSYNDLLNALSVVDNCLQLVSEHVAAAAGAGAGGVGAVAGDLVHMRRAVDHIADLLDMAQDFEAARRGRLQLRAEAVDVDALLERVAAQSGSWVAEGAALEVDTPEPGLLARADGARLRRALLSLVKAAARFTKEGRIRLRAAAQGREVLVVEVEGAGAGRKGAALEAGLRGDWAAAPEIALCGAIVRRMDGDIRSDAAGAAGRRVVLYLPAAEPRGEGLREEERGGGEEGKGGGEEEKGGAAKRRAEDPARAAAPRRRKRRRARGALPARLRVLVCDDAASVRKLITRRLRKLSEQWEFVEVENGERAMEVLDRTRFDVIIMDEYMDQADGRLEGHAVVREIRARKIDAVIVACSGAAHRHELFAVGANLVWGKPLPSDAAIVEQLGAKLSGLPGRVGVLIVDDQRVCRMVARTKLRKLGHESWDFHMAADAEEALRIYEQRRGRIDLVLVDEMLGEHSESGTQLIARLRGMGSAAVIVGISGAYKAPNHLQAGADLSWGKPLPSNETIWQQLAPRLQALPRGAGEDGAAPRG